MSFEAYQIGTVLNLDSRDFAEKYGKAIGPFFKIEISDTSNRIIFSAEAVQQDGGYDLNGLIVTSVEWEENDCQADMMTLTVQNPDVQLQDSRLFAIGNSIDLWMGYDGHLPDYMGRGIIVESEPTFSSGSMCTINVTAYDIAYFMMEESRAEIDTDGTQWWERRRAPLSEEEERQIQVIVSDAIRDSERDRTEDVANAMNSAPGSGAEMVIPDETIDENYQTADIERSVHLHQFQQQLEEEERQRRLEDHPFEMARTSSPSRGRRGRNGKVWRDKTDSQIAIAIFESYGIVPYVDSSGERSARGYTSTVEVEVRGEVFSDAHADSRSEAERTAQEQQEGLGRVVMRPGAVDDVANTTPRPLNETETHIYTNTRTESRTIEHAGRRVVQKSGTTDWEFLKQLASDHGYIVFVFYSYENGHWCGYWGPMSNVPQIIHYELKFNHLDFSTLESFRPKESLRGQSTEIDLTYVNPRDRRQYTMRVTMENISRYSTEFRGPDASRLMQDPLGSGPEAVLMIHGQRVSVPLNRSFTDAEDARRWLMSFWIRHASEFCEAEGKMIIGVPDVHARHRHNVVGVGRYSGAYFFTKVTHRMGAGSAYETTFSGFKVNDMMFQTASTDDVAVETVSIGHSRAEWLARL